MGGAAGRQCGGVSTCLYEIGLLTTVSRSASVASGSALMEQLPTCLPVVLCYALQDVNKDDAGEDLQDALQDS